MSAIASITKQRTAAKTSAINAEANQRTRIFLQSVIGVLLVIGLGATLSASSVLAAEADGEILSLWTRQVIAVGVGIVVMLLAARVPYRAYQRLAPVIWGASLAGLVLVLFIGRTAGGSSRWIDLGIIDIQPSEAAKFGVIVLLAAVYAKKEERKEIAEFREEVDVTRLELLALGPRVRHPAPLGRLPNLGS